MITDSNIINGKFVRGVKSHWLLYGRRVVPIVVLSVVLHVLLRIIWQGERVTVFVVGIWPLYVVAQLYMLYRCGVSAIHSVFVLATMWCYYVSYHFLHINEGFKYLAQYDLVDILPYGNQIALEWVSILLIITVLWVLSDNIASIVMILMLYISEPVFVIESLRIHMKNVTSGVNGIYMSVVVDGVIWLVICVVVIVFFVHRAMVKRNRKIGDLACNAISAGRNGDHSVCIYGDHRGNGCGLIYFFDIVVIFVFLIVNIIPGVIRSQLAYKYNINIVNAQNKIVNDVSGYISLHVVRDANKYNAYAADHAYSEIAHDMVVFQSPRNKYLLNTEHDIQCLRGGMYWRPNYNGVSVVVLKNDVIKLSPLIDGGVCYILAVHDMAQDKWRPLLVTDNECAIRSDSYMNISIDDFDVYE